MGHSITFSNLNDFMRQGMQSVECPICREEFGAERPTDQDSEYPNLIKILSRDAIVETSCNHQFHRGCLLNWILGQRKQHCPYCKHVLFTATTEAEYKEQEAEEARQSQLETVRLLSVNTNPAERRNLLNTAGEQNIIAEGSNEYLQLMWSAVQRELGRVGPDDVNHPFSRARARAWRLETDQV